MTLEFFKSNLQQEKKLIGEILVFYEQFSSAPQAEKDFFLNAILSLLNQIAILNNSVPDMVKKVSTAKELPIIVEPLHKEKLIQIFVPEGMVAISSEDKKLYFKELGISDKAIKMLKKKPKKEKREEIVTFRKPSRYASASSHIFSKFSFKFAEKGNFKTLSSYLRRANMPYLLPTYLSIMFFTTLLVLIFSFSAAIFLSFLKISLSGIIPSISFQFPSAVGLIKNILYSFLLPLITFCLFYLFPFAESSSLKGRINNELPFVIIHMSSIAGSGIEPSKIFRIIATSSEYPNVSKELKKLINQINLYGYDLITALRYTAKTTSSEKLAELLNGLATNIASGGSLKDYLEKKASDTLLDYRLERKKYANMAETSMDIYIGILIAAPLIFMVLLILIGAIGINVGNLSVRTLSFLIIAGVALLNIFFLIYLQLRRPLT